MPDSTLHAWEGTSEVLLQRELCFWFGGGTRSRTSAEAEPALHQGTPHKQATSHE